MPPDATFNPVLYPVGFNLQHQTVLIVGAGQVATRKLTRLLTTGCTLYCISEGFSAAFDAIWPPALVSHRVPKAYSDSILDMVFPQWVFACTDSAQVNHQIVMDCRQRGIWVNNASQGMTDSDFIVPSVMAYGDLTIAMYSGGTSPVFLKQLRQSLESLLGPWVEPYLSLLGRLRETIQAQVPDETQRLALLQMIAHDETILNGVKSGDDIDILYDQTRTQLGL